MTKVTFLLKLRTRCPITGDNNNHRGFYCLLQKYFNSVELKHFQGFHAVFKVMP